MIELSLAMKHQPSATPRSASGQRVDAVAIEGPTVGRTLAGGHDGHGQAVAEFAIVAPVLLLLLLGLAQFGMIFEAQIGMANATRESARRAAAAPSPTCAWVLDEIKPTSGTGLLSANVQGYQDSRSSVTVAFSAIDTSGPTPYQTVTVKSSYEHPLILPVIREIIDAIDGTTDSNFAISVGTQMRIETTNAGLDGATCAR